MLTKVNTTEIASVADVTKALEDAKSAGKTSVLAMFDRHGAHTFVALPLVAS